MSKHTQSRIRTLAAMLATVAALPLAAGASEDERIRAPARATLTLQEAADAAVHAFGGRAVEVELEREDGRLYYEVKLRRDGERLEVYVDARTGEVYGPERPRRAWRFRRDDD